MYPTDSISSFKIAAGHEGVADDGDFIPDEGVKMPKDVIEALNDDNLELAMFLLDRHREAEGKMGTPSRYPALTFIKKFFPKIQFPRWGRANSKKALRSKNKSQVFVHVAKVMGQVILKVIQVPTKMVTKLTQVAAKVTLKGLNFVQNQIVKPVMQPFVKLAEKIMERYRAVETYVGQRVEKVLERVHEIREKVAHELEKLTQEFHNLAKPVRLWLENRLEKVINTQKWVNTVVGEQVVKIAQQAIQIVPYALIPVTFSVKRISKSYRAMVKKIGDSSKKAFSKARGWVKGKMAKGAVALNQAIRAFVGAVERVSYIWGFKLWRALMALIRFLGRVLILTIHLFQKLATWSLQALRR